MEVLFIEQYPLAKSKVTMWCKSIYQTEGKDITLPNLNRMV